ncbi:hypothetical protein HPB51_012466 [Rhipicephalus microplus]|uniref:CB1 cannabinoid receptor-interacting protein 1 n=1 Tax=Rhipicephalus microplus TaxID=6941 RepID=A0A9J6E9J0_RHIMP|nr:hypothetical protein HPB51_012466 [Rhipicephalus microplus]
MVDNSSRSFKVVLSMQREGNNNGDVHYKILDVGELLVNLQVKFYKEKDKEHATWGNALHQIDLDCEVSRSSGSLVVNKQSFR